MILLKKFPSEEEDEEDEDDEDDDEPPATLKTFPPEFLFASSAALKATSKISPQCLHFFASFLTSSWQYGHICIVCYVLGCSKNKYTEFE